MSDIGNIVTQSIQLLNLPENVCYTNNGMQISLTNDGLYGKRTNNEEYNSTNKRPCNQQDCPSQDVLDLSHSPTLSPLQHNNTSQQRSFEIETAESCFSITNSSSIPVSQPSASHSHASQIDSDKYPLIKRLPHFGGIFITLIPVNESIMI